MDELTRCKCGREYYPKQAWIHTPVCRYVDDIEPNHVPAWARGPATSETQKRAQTGVRLSETETASNDETPWGKLGISRATYFRRKADLADAPQHSHTKDTQSS